MGQQLIILYETHLTEPGNTGQRAGANHLHVGIPGSLHGLPGMFPEHQGMCLLTYQKITELHFNPHVMFLIYPIMLKKKIISISLPVMK